MFGVELVAVVGCLILLGKGTYPRVETHSSGQDAFRVLLHATVAVWAAYLLFWAPAAKADLTFDVAAGYNFSEVVSEGGGFDGPKDTARFSLTWQPDDANWFVSYTHVSHWSAGWPVNNEPEDWVDMIEIGYRFNLSRIFE